MIPALDCCSQDLDHPIPGVASSLSSETPNVIQYHPRCSLLKIDQRIKMLYDPTHGSFQFGSLGRHKAAKILQLTGSVVLQVWIRLEGTLAFVPIWIVMIPECIYRDYLFTEGEMFLYDSSIFKFPLRL